MQEINCLGIITLIKLGKINPHAMEDYFELGTCATRLHAKILPLSFQIFQQTMLKFSS